MSSQSAACPVPALLRASELSPAEMAAAIAVDAEAIAGRRSVRGDRTECDHHVVRPPDRLAVPVGDDVFSAPTRDEVRITEQALDLLDRRLGTHVLNVLGGLALPLER